MHSCFLIFIFLFNWNLIHARTLKCYVANTLEFPLKHEPVYMTPWRGEQEASDTCVLTGGLSSRKLGYTEWAGPGLGVLDPTLLGPACREAPRVMSGYPWGMGRGIFSCCQSLESPATFPPWAHQTCMTPELRSAPFQAQLMFLSMGHAPAWR